MRRLVWAIIFVISVGVGSAAAQVDYCFKNNGLKLAQTVSFTLTSSKLEGTFQSGEYDESSSSETFEFTGTKQGNILTIKFQGTVPYETAPGSRSIRWTLGRTSLKIPMYGKNYNSGKFAVYIATFGKCREI